MSSNERKTMFRLYVLLLGFNVIATARGVFGEKELKTDLKANVSTIEAKSKVAKRHGQEAQRREHVINLDGTINYQGSGSGHDSGDLIPPHERDFNVKIEQKIGSKYGPPSNSYGVPKVSFGSSRPSNFYGPPSKNSFRPPKFGYLPPAPPKPQYGPPSSFPTFSSLPLRPVYGPPKGHNFGPPSPPKGGFGISKPILKPGFSSRPRPAYGPPNFFPGTPLSAISSVSGPSAPPKTVYGTPLLPSSSYGSPKPPSSTDIKFDGWKPIPGLVSNPPSASYGPPAHTGQDGSNFIGSNSAGGLDFHSSSHPINTHSFGSSHHSSTSFGSSSFSSSGPEIQLRPSTFYKPPSTPNLSYGTPLAPSTSYGFPEAPKGGSTFFGPTSGSTFSKELSGDFHFKSPKPYSGHSKPPSTFFSSYKSPSSTYGPPKPKPSISYGPPSLPPFPTSGSSFGHIKPISSSYGPPKPSSSYGPPKPPSSSYGPPKPPSGSYGPPKPPSGSFGPPKPPSFYLPTTGPTNSFGPPKIPSGSYGPPSISSTSFEHSKFPSGFQNVPSGPGLSYKIRKPLNSLHVPSGPNVPTGYSRPSNSYGVPTGPSGTLLPRPPTASYGPPSINTNYKIPKPGISFSTPPSIAYRGPPVPHPLQPPAVGSSVTLEGLYNKPVPPTALYGVPDAPPATALGCCGVSSLNIGLQEAPSNFEALLKDIKMPVLPPTGIAPAPPADVPYQVYGTPLQSTGVENLPNVNVHQVIDSNIPSTVLPLSQPKKPVKFRPPVPAGLISSIGAKWSSSGAWKEQSQSHHHHHQHQHQHPSAAYIPPAVPDPDPGVQANKGNPTIVPPPTAPPVQYGPPPSSSSLHEGNHHVSNQLGGTVSHVNDIDTGLSLPPPSPASPPSGPPDESDYEIQQSIPFGLPSLDSAPINDNQNYHSSDTTNYNSNVESGHYQASESYSKALGGRFENEVHTIPIKGGQGSYTLEIQAAGGNSGQHEPHAEVLSNGLLQDILAAIENPSESIKLNQYSNSHQNDPIANEIGMSVFNQLGSTLTQDSPTGHHLPSQYGKDLASASSDNIPKYSRSDKISDDSSTFYATISKEDKLKYKHDNQSQGKISEYLNNNNIAFYYNDEREVENRTIDGKDLVIVKTLPENATQFDSQKTDFRSYGSINMPNPQNINPNNMTSAADILKKNFSRLQLNRDSLS